VALSLSTAPVKFEAHHDHRSEASAIPQLLVGNTTRSDLDIGHDKDVLFREGTFIAVDDDHFVRFPNQDYGEESVAVDPEDRFYQLLLKRFYQLRNTLAKIAEQMDSHGKPSTLAASDKTCLQTKSRRAWSDSIGQEHPTADRVVQLGSAIVYDGLQYCANTLDHATSLSPQTSSWIWSLLASIGDVGTLDNEKISRVRDLALKAGLMRNRLRKTNARDESSHTRGGAICGKGVDVKTTHNVEDSACEDGFPGDVGETKDIDSAQEDTKSLQDRTFLFTNDSVDESETVLGPALSLHSGQCAPASPINESESGAEMSVSGDEEDYVFDASDPDQARAQLLSQLGDRLVHAQPPLSANHSKTAQRDQYSGDSEYDMDKPLPAQKSSRSIKQVDDNNPGGEGVAGRTSDGLAGDGADLNTRVTIDMILTVAAECFGQKDLLKYRNRW
jgi:hypothetical protein